MRGLRPVMSLLLILMVLPWGAYAGAGLSPVPPLASYAAFNGAAEDALAARHQAEDRGHAVVPVSKRCRTGALAGSPCGPDLALPGRTMPDPGNGSHIVRWPDKGWTSAGVILTAILDPPRRG